MSAIGSVRAELDTNLTAAETAEHAAPAEIGLELAEGLAGEPSERDRRIYEAICVARRSAEAVASEFGLSTATVRNVARQTREALARQHHELLQMNTLEALLVHYDRLAWQFEQVNAAWEASGGERMIVHRTFTKSDGSGEPSRNVPERVSTRTLTKEPDPRYMTLSDRILDKMQVIAAQIQELHAQRERAAAKATSAAPSAAGAAPAGPFDDPALEQIRRLAAEREPGDTRPRVYERVHGGPWVEKQPRERMSSHEKYLRKMEKRRQAAGRGLGGDIEQSHQNRVSSAPQPIDSTLVRAPHAGS